MVSSDPILGLLGGHSSLENSVSRVSSLYRRGVIVGLRGCFNIGPNLVNVKIMIMTGSSSMEDDSSLERSSPT
jgi:hypothetical protein